MFPDRLADDLLMLRRTDPVGDDPGKGQVRVEAGKAFDHRRDTLRGGADINDQDHRQVQYFGQVRRRPFAAVKQPHHPLDHCALLRPGIVGKGAPDEIGTAHADIEVAGDPPGDHPVQGRVDEIRPAFEGLNRNATPLQGGKNP
jgi:hypothetical protein